ncbi:MAG: CheR family methyltransferase [bacterium]|nr:CheR family methyltransferase [bacterium]
MLPEHSPAAATRLHRLVRERFRLQLTDCRPPHEVGGLLRLAHSRGYPAFDDFLDLVEEDRTGKLAFEVVNRLGATVGEFQPARIHLDLLRRELLPTWEEGRRKGRVLRFWVPGCGTGGDVWLLACELDERLGPAAAECVSILGTDCSAQALTTAMEGVYDDDSLRRLPCDLRTRCFDEADSQNWCVADRLRGLVRFRRHSSAARLPIVTHGLDAVFCAGALRYLDPETRRAVVRRYAEVLRPGGWLLTGGVDLCGAVLDGHQVHPGVYRRPRCD